MFQYKTGPHMHLESADGQQVPFFIIRFDKHGQCLNEKALDHLLGELPNGSDVFIFAHGWNNDWSTALARYQGFFSGYTQMRRKYKLPMPAHYKPVLVGLVWPSTALVFGESERGPKGQHAKLSSEMLRQQALEEVEALAEFMRSERERTQLRAFAQLDELTDEQARELASLVTDTLQATEGEQPLDEPFNIADLLEGWAYLPSHEEFEAVASMIKDSAEPVPIKALKGSKKYDPRVIIRLLTVMKMKDRAGVVGVKGVSPMLLRILSDTTLRVHLQGHSYGSKVVLSALCTSETLPRKAHSMLLLQPAISRVCFASQIPKEHYGGGYRDATARVKRPIVSTFSSADFSLYNLYHYVQWRARDIGERAFFPAGEDNRRAALGGYGPRYAKGKLIPIRDVGQHYAAWADAPILGLDGSGGQIGGHGDVLNLHTWWALYSLVS